MSHFKYKRRRLTRIVCQCPASRDRVAQDNAFIMQS